MGSPHPAAGTESALPSSVHARATERSGDVLDLRSGVTVAERRILGDTSTLAAWLARRRVDAAAELIPCIARVTSPESATRDALGAWLAPLRALRPAPRALTIELDDRARSLSGGDLTEIAAHLAACGIHLALGPFGASSWGAAGLARIAPALLVYDRRLVTRLDHFAFRLDALARLEQLARAAGATTLAVDVDDEGDLAALRAAGVGAASGPAVHASRRCA